MESETRVIASGRRVSTPPRCDLRSQPERAAMPGFLRVFLIQFCVGIGGALARDGIQCEVGSLRWL